MSADGNGGWVLAGSVRTERVPHRWTFVGGDEDAEAVELYIIAQHPTDPELVQRRRVRVPLRVDDVGLVVGTVEVLEA